MNAEKELYKDRFKIITFIESEQEHAKYLEHDSSKGASEMFAINYAFNNSNMLKQSTFIIKITCCYFIPELENYLSKYDLNNYDCLTQNTRLRCEMVGSHIKNFHHIFYLFLVNKQNYYISHIESLWEERTSDYDRILICDLFQIEPTQRGGIDLIYNDI